MDMNTELISGLIQFGLLAIVIERALYVVFEWEAFKRFEAFTAERGWVWFDLKPPISVAVGAWLATLLSFDITAVVTATEAVSEGGMIVTGFFLAGGSKGFFKFLKSIRELRDARKQAELRTLSGDTNTKTED